MTKLHKKIGKIWWFETTERSQSAHQIRYVADFGWMHARQIGKGNLEKRTVGKIK
jgi:hypothetical protein